jgi:hypothetical protein
LVSNDIADPKQWCQTSPQSDELGREDMEMSDGLHLGRQRGDNVLPTKRT